MKPEIVLKLNPVGITTGQVYSVRDEWIKEYEKWISWSPANEDLGAILIDRVNRAAKLVINRYIKNPAGYDETDAACLEEDKTLDGDFPLGNAYDAEFATPYFTIERLVQIQFGETYNVHTGHYVEPAYDVLVRKGIIAELEQEWAEAEYCYGGVGFYSESVMSRQHDCRLKKIAEGERAYAEAQHYMETGEWSAVFAPLQRAVDMDNADAMTDMGLARLYGTFGICLDYDEGLTLLRDAARTNARACMELVELHDMGIPDIEGEEAQELCQKAAKLGDKKAIVRLEDGFDLRPMTEVLEEQAEKGNVDALWWLHYSYTKQKCQEEAQLWYDKALEAGQVDALLTEADKYLHKNSDSYNKELAGQYLRRAADQGNIRAIIGLSELELDEGDESFWQVAIKKNEPDFSVEPALLERHKRQFAWFKLAAEAEDAESMNSIAVAYHFGYPVERDDQEAFRWAETAADAKNYAAMYQTAYFLENGFGCNKDISRAVQLYEASAEQGGIISSMLRLYEIYKDGLADIPADKEKSSRYLWLSGFGRD